MATYHTSSSAGGGGDGSYGSPWTLQEAADGAVAGDVVKVHNDGTYTLTAAVDFDTNSGSATGIIQFIGVGALESAGPEQVTIDASGHANDAIYINGQSWLCFESLSVDKGGSNGNPWQADSGAGHLHFVKCKGIGSGDSHGFNIRETDMSVFVGCEAYDNYKTGIVLLHSTLGAGAVLGCASHANGEDGIAMTRICGPVWRCVAFDNGGAGILANALAANVYTQILHCTALNNTGDGIELAMNSDAEVLVANNGAVRNGGYGLNCDTAGTDVVAFGNLWPASGTDANTSGSTNNVDVLGNPGYVLRPNLAGAQIADFYDYSTCYPDLRLDSNSDALGAAWPGCLPITDVCTTTTTAAPTTTTVPPTTTTAAPTTTTSGA